jgi:hypothetical protein
MLILSNSFRILYLIIMEQIDVSRSCIYFLLFFRNFDLHLPMSMRLPVPGFNQTSFVARALSIVDIKN